VDNVNSSIILNQVLIVTKKDTIALALQKNVQFLSKT